MAGFTFARGAAVSSSQQRSMSTGWAKGKALTSCHSAMRFCRDQPAAAKKAQSCNLNCLECVDIKQGWERKVNGQDA